MNGEVINTMTYDNYGNIISKNGKQYCYDEIWQDLLTCYDGRSIQYDKQGNPVKYLGHTLTWEKGRQLKSFDGNTYTYNANGIRTSKTVDGVKHTYTLDGTKILREVWGSNTLIPLYDNEDSVCGILYNNVPYYFIKNLQGDIIAIVNKKAETIARYSYDAWGACTSAVTYTELTEDVDIAAINPFRYRGYYFDEEIGFYYLQSRYYDACVGRFVNGDQINVVNIILDISIHNLCSYCCNDPINDSDKSGYFSLKGIYKSIKKYINISWKGITISLSRTLTVVVGALALIYRVFNIITDIRGIHSITNNKMATAIIAALPYGSAYISSEIIAWVCNVGAVVAAMSLVLSFVISCCTGGVFTIAKTIISFIISYVAPTLISAIQMLYYGIKKRRGCKYTFYYIGGASVSF